MEAKKNDIIMQNKIFGWIALATGMILSIPLVAMQFTDEVVWSWFDFVVMGTLLLGAGATFVLLSRKIRKYRVVIGMVCVIIFLYIWAELAVGIFTNLGS